MEWGKMIAGAGLALGGSLAFMVGTDMIATTIEKAMNEKQLQEEVWKDAARFGPNHSAVGAMDHVRGFRNRVRPTRNTASRYRVENPPIEDEDFTTPESELHKDADSTD